MTVTKMRYIQTPFHGHRVLAFINKNDSEWGEATIN